MSTEANKIQKQIEALLNENHSIDKAMKAFYEAGASSKDLEQKKIRNAKMINRLMAKKVEALNGPTQKRGAKK